MRRGNTPVFVENDKHEFCGVNLSADFCAEHEWGIAGIKQGFGLTDPNNKYGIERRRIQTIPEESKWDPILKFFQAGKNWCLAYAHSDLMDYISKKKGHGELSIYGSEELAAAWDADSFGVLVEDSAKNKLEELYTAFKNKDIAIMFGGRDSIISNPGLCLVIVSRVDQEVKDRMEAEDRDYERLLLAAEGTGIEKFLTKSGKQWFSLKPRWIDKDSRKRSGHQVMFWLNPVEQSTTNYGWFTVEDLRAWVVGKGPIPK